ncbi:hypothetical protein M0R72_18135 [Candidatus Pacearchaeota archaeon]|jgi:hypothetical protein|nr:hypothetical protein [Candidatus Pacearchaeota archaeon]
MIRFIDLSLEYENGRTVCAFLNTANDRFLKSNSGEHTFTALWEIEQHPLAEQLLGLVPENFFTK